MRLKQAELLVLEQAELLVLEQEQEELLFSKLKAKQPANLAIRLNAVSQTSHTSLRQHWQHQL